MAERYLKALKDGKVVAVGDDKSVTITGEPANTRLLRVPIRLRLIKQLTKV